MEKKTKYCKILCIIYLLSTIMYYCLLSIPVINVLFSFVGAHGLYFIFMLFLLLADTFLHSGPILPYACLLCEAVYALSLIVVTIFALKKKRYTPLCVFMMISNAISIITVFLAYWLNGIGVQLGGIIGASIVGNIIYSTMFFKATKER